MAQGLEAPQLLVAGKYRLTRMLGRGGMGSVWEGVHATLGTRVAVKFIEVEHLDSPEARNRFENEARAAATLRSKHVVEVYDHGVSADGRQFIVMEYLEGEPLDRRLDRLGRLPAREVAKLLQQVCRALGKAHAAGIVHRDLKPENIFLVWDDEDAADIAKVVDFGIAKFTDQSLGATSATRTGSVLGTPYYMSPEQARGLRSVDHRADLWSLGVIAYRCIVGKLPFEGEAIGDLLVKICTTPVPIPSHVAFDVPNGFDAFIARALAREPADRFQTAQEFAESLAMVCGISVRHAAVPSVDFAPSAASGPYSPVRGPTPTPPSHGSAVTGDPFTQTPPLGRSSRHVGKMVAGGIALLVAIGVGIVVLAKPFGSSVNPESSQGAAAPVLATPPPTEAEVAAPEAPPAAPVVIPDSSAEIASPPVGGAPSATPEVQPPKHGVQRPARPAAVKRAMEPSAPAPRVTEAAPAPQPQPQPQPQPPRAPSKREIDVGY